MKIKTIVNRCVCIVLTVPTHIQKHIKCFVGVYEDSSHSISAYKLWFRQLKSDDLATQKKTQKTLKFRRYRIASVIRSRFGTNAYRQTTRKTLGYESTVSRRLNTTCTIQREGKWLPH